jgi:catechol 2,3-dioxygenase-like lactoylglutathione lyase family enzyme
MRLIGINHVALEVDDIAQALEWYGRFFDLQLRGQRSTMAWIDMGDQFLALSAPRRSPPDADRHFGLVVDDKEGIREALRVAGVEVEASGHLGFTDPWGNNVEIVGYRDVQFAKTPEALRVAGAGDLPKSEAARDEMRAKGLLDT